MPLVANEIQETGYHLGVTDSIMVIEDHIANNREEMSSTNRHTLSYAIKLIRTLSQRWPETTPMHVRVQAMDAAKPTTRRNP